MGIDQKVVRVMEELHKNLKDRGMADISPENLQKILEDEELSKAFFLLFMFSLATGQSFEEIAKSAMEEDDETDKTDKQPNDGALPPRH
jgi:hypothetical protein